MHGAPARSVRETGGAELVVGAIADGQLVARDGAGLVGVGGGLVERAHGILVPHVGVLANGVAQPADGRTYFFWLGVALRDGVIARVGVPHSSNGTGVTGEVGLVTSPLTPRREAGQTMTKKWASALPSLDAGSGAPRFNSAANAVAHARGENLWLAVRVTATTTLPSFQQIIRSWATGLVLYADAAGAMTGVSSWSASVLPYGTLAPAIFAADN